MIEIKSRWDSSKVLYVAKDATDIRQALEEAVDRDANLRGANLRGAYLRGANLRGAYLRGANLGGANLRGAYLGDAYLGDAYLRDANLRGAYLGGANLGGANLRDAYLRGAYLRDAYLGDAYLGDAYLRGAYLGGANLGGANLRGAYLRDAYLRGAYLRDAYLRDANLRDAYLRGANLGGANLRGAYQPIDGPSHPFWASRQDYWSILDRAPGEVAALREVIVDGRINGSVYNDSSGCGCLNGTIAILRECYVDDLPAQTGIVPSGSRPAEQWYIAIKKGDKPLPLDTKEWPSESVFRISYALAWLDEWVESRKAICAALTKGEK